MPRRNEPRFGSVGIEREHDGERRVMYVTDEAIVVLSTDIPDESFLIGVVDGMEDDTEWGLNSDIDLAEILEIHLKSRQDRPELLR